MWLYPAHPESDKQQDKQGNGQDNSNGEGDHRTVCFSLVLDQEKHPGRQGKQNQDKQDDDGYLE